MSRDKSAYFKYIMLVSELLGLAPYRVFQHETKLCSLLRLVSLLFLITCCLLCAGSINTWDSLSLKVKVRLGCVFIVILTQIGSYGKINATFKNVIAFTVPYDPFEGNSLVPIKHFTIHVFVYMVQFVFYYFTHSTPSAGTLLHSVIAYLYIEFPSLQFVFLIGVCRRYQFSLRNALNISDSQLAQHPSQVVDVLKLCRQKNLELVVLCDSITATYACQVLVLISVSFLELIFFLGNTFSIFIINSTVLNTDNLLEFLCNLSIVLILFIKTILMARTCHTLLDESKYTMNSVCNLANRTFDKHVKIEAIMILLQRNNFDFKFSILGLFNMDYMFVYTVLSTVTTYGLLFAILLLTQSQIN